MSAWRVQPSKEWIRVLPNEAPVPQQGWKLHLSAGLLSAERILSQALPVLLAERVSFKVAASPQVLGALNEGHGGRSQVGKFLTVYPRDDAHAVHLASRLDEATRGLSAPSIASDRPLRPGSCVFYRYGSFSSRHMQTPLGQVMTLLEAPDGQLVPDRREPVYRVPAWAKDPFIAAGVAAQLPEAATVLAERYAPVAVLHRTHRSTVLLAIDLKEMRKCVLKQVTRSAGDDAAGSRRLRHELEVLTLLAPSPWFPAPYQYVEDETFAYLSMEDIEGETLEVHVRKLSARGCFATEAQLLSWGRQLAEALASLHERGLVHGDVKAPNVIITSSGKLRLIDLELAHGASAPRVTDAGKGTRGYMTREQFSGQASTVADDVYALGALLYFAATSAEPSLAPEGSLLSRPLSLLNPLLSPRLAAFIARCLTPEHRPDSMREVIAALSELDASPPSIQVPGLEPLAGVAPPVDLYRMQARRLGDTLVHVAQRVPSQGALFWNHGHLLGGGLPSLDINLGSAGILLTLSALVSAFDEPGQRATLAEAARWLAKAPRPEGPPHPGLYVGEAGVGLALLRAGRVLEDEGLLREARKRARLIASLPFASPDLFNGTAGRARFHLELWRELDSSEDLQAALAAGAALIDGAQRSEPEGLLKWAIPPGYDGLSGQIQPGYAHGAAGIADTLLELYEATQEKRFLEAARGAGRWLVSQAAEALEDGSGLCWPQQEGGPPHAALWCHGAAGIGKFFLHASRLEILPEAAGFAARAARTVARGTRWTNPVQCHGLSGNIEFLLDMFQATREQEYLDGAYALAQALEAFAVEKEGQLYWPAENPESFSPSYLVGYAGVAACLLRLAEPAHRVSLLR
ncbi:class IV lanthionine synthetase LanL [Archangium lipolyticum]|uniref:class IV lanthionine synthetase LanL n=1 Tax=Archangium lipolyticum TaxID=2970465 RepID=UPI00214A245E|nr:class IV lanthionine synthetase LanL [Archangium lipolyticum]